MPKTASRTPVSPQQELVAALREKLIPWAKAGQLHAMAGVLPLRAPPAIEVCAQNAPLLKPVKSSRRADVLVKSFASSQWKKQGLLTLRHLSFVFVLEGHADLQIGVTEAMAHSDARLSPKHGRYVLRLPERGLLAVPPAIPFSDGMSAHWEKGAIPLEDAHADLLWLGLLPEGVMLHICRTRGATHIASPKHFVLDFHAARIGQLIAELLQNSGQNPGAPREIACLHLQALLLGLQHALSSGGSTHDASGQRIPHSSAGDRAIQSKTQTPDAIVIERACDYIAAHLTQPLTAGQIADYAYASPSHLNRLFRTELDSSVMQFVTQRRIEAAQSLLLNTGLPVSSIGSHLGYRHAAHFSLVFKRALGLSPAQFRSHCQREAATKS